MFRLTIADDHAVVRAGLRRLIEVRKDWSIVAEAQDGPQAVSQAIAHRPDVAIVDYSLPFANGTEVTRQIRKLAPEVQVLVLTMHDSDVLTREVITAGARGCMLKSDTACNLYSAIDAAVRRAKSSEVTSCSNSASSPLTSQEHRVVQLICCGHSNKSIGRLLGISFKTVETHRANIMHKLDLSSAAALVRYAVRNQLIEP